MRGSLPRSGGVIVGFGDHLDMADGRGERELVFCHACENEWYRDQNGLECPGCHSDVVEVIDRNNDPRNARIDSTSTSDDEGEDLSRNADALPHHPLHRHNPWANDIPDPDEGDIEHVAFNPAPGIHFQRTTFRSTSPPGHNSRDPFPPLFTSFTAGLLNGGHVAPGAGHHQGPFSPPGSQHVHPPRYHSPFPTNPPGNPPFRTNVRVFGAGDQSINSLHAVMQTMLASIQANAVHADSDNRGPNQGPREGNAFDFILQSLTQLHDPTRAAHGDAVFTDEALDRIISQMMDQQGGAGSAPGPATAAAIAALPKKQADKDMVGTDGKAECSVCMDAVTLGDEVTVLPCKHWFHGECVGAWLTEHDTCPHCRQGIMPKDGPSNATTPRSPDQLPRHGLNQWTLGPGNSGGARSPNEMPSPGQTAHDARRRTRSVSLNGQRIQTPGLPSMPGAWTQPGMQHPYVPGGYPAYPEPQDFVQPPLDPQQPPRAQQYQSSQAPNSASPSSPERRRQSNSRESSSGSGNGEGSTNSAGSRVTGWFRNLRGNGSNEQR